MASISRRYAPKRVISQGIARCKSGGARGSWGNNLRKSICKSRNQRPDPAEGLSGTVGRGGFGLAAWGELIYGFGARDVLHTARTNLEGPSTAPVSSGQAIYGEPERFQGGGTDGWERRWLPSMDLNHDKQIQSLLCYRYTTRQSSAWQTLKIPA